MDGFEFTSPFQLIGTSVKELNIQNDFNRLIFDSETEKVFDLNYKITDIKSINDNVLQGKMNLYLVIELKRDAGSFNFSLVLEGCFVIGADQKDAFEQMLTINGASTLYSIARTIVLSVCGVSVSGDQIILPMINFVKVAHERVTEKVHKKKK